jgi:hypothetical protein
VTPLSDKQARTARVGGTFNGTVNLTEPATIVYSNYVQGGTLTMVAAANPVEGALATVLFTGNGSTITWTGFVNWSDGLAPVTSWTGPRQLTFGYFGGQARVAIPEPGVQPTVAGGTFIPNQINLGTNHAATYAYTQTGPITLTVLASPPPTGGANATVTITGNNDAITPDNTTVKWADGSIGPVFIRSGRMRTLVLEYDPTLTYSLAAFIHPDRTSLVWITGAASLTAPGAGSGLEIEDNSIIIYTGLGGSAITLPSRLSSADTDLANKLTLMNHGRGSALTLPTSLVKFGDVGNLAVGAIADVVWMHNGAQEAVDVRISTTGAVPVSAPVLIELVSQTKTSNSNPQILSISSTLDWVAGDYVIALWGCAKNTSRSISVAGDANDTYTEIEHAYGAGGAITYRAHIGLWRGTIGSGAVDVSTIFTMNNNNRCVLGLASIRGTVGVDNGGAAHSTAAGAQTTAPTAPAITTVTDQCLVVIALAVAGNGTSAPATYAPPAGFTLALDGVLVGNTGADADYCKVSLAYKVFAGPATVPAAVWSGTGLGGTAGWSAVQVAFSP